MPDPQDNESSNGEPDIVSNITKVADAKLTTLLFGRSAKAAGDFLGERVEGFFKQRKEEAQQKNVEDHVSRVVEVVGEPLDIKPTQYVKIERWVRIVADVATEDAERSALFEAVLVDIISSKGTSEYQEVAEKLTSDTARLLLNAPTSDGITPTGADQRGFEDLRSLGLARTLGLRQLLALIVAWLIGTVIGLIAIFNVVPRYFPKLLAIEFIAEAVAISLVLMVLVLAAISTNYRLTEFGTALQRSARRFYQNRKRLRGVAVLSAMPKSPWGLGLSAALLACILPPILELYLPALLRTTGRPTVVISSAPANQNSPATPPSNSTGPTPTLPTDQVTLSTDEILALIEFWNSIKDQMNGITNFTSQGQSLVETWQQEVEKNRDEVASRLLSMTNSINARRSSLIALMNIYRKYPNVEPILREISNEGVFTSLHLAFQSFASETQAVPLPPKNFEERLKPYASALKAALAAMTKWANAKGEFATLQSHELSKVEVK